MKSLPPALQAHLDEGTTTLAWCWRITRADGVTFGFTDHDRTLTFDGTEFEPESGLTASEVRSGSDLSVDAQDAQGVLSSDRITETDILDGRSGTQAGGSGGAGGGGRAGGATADDLKAVEAAELAGIDAVRDALGRAYEDVKDLGKGIGETLVGAFRSAEAAVGDFVRNGKLDVKNLVSSMIADFAQLAARKFLFAPLSAALSGALGGGFGGLFGGSAATVAATVRHAGGMAGAGPLRIVEAAAFLRAPRLHAGTPSWLRADEYATILQRGERVLNRRETAAYERGHLGAPPVVNIHVRDAESFRQSRTQVASDIARAVAFGRRGT